LCYVVWGDAQVVRRRVYFDSCPESTHLLNLSITPNSLASSLLHALCPPMWDCDSKVALLLAKGCLIGSPWLVTAKRNDVLELVWLAQPCMVHQSIRSVGVQGLGMRLQFIWRPGSLSCPPSFHLVQYLQYCCFTAVASLVLPAHLKWTG